VLVDIWAIRKTEILMMGCFPWKESLRLGGTIGFLVVGFVGNKLAEILLAETGYTEMAASVQASGACGVIARKIDLPDDIPLIPGQLDSQALNAIRNALGSGMDKMIDLFTKGIEHGIGGRMDKSKASNIANTTNQILKGVLERDLEISFEVIKAFRDFMCGSPVSAIFDLIQPTVSCWIGCKKDRCLFGPVAYVEKAPEEVYDTFEDDRQICKCGPDWHHGVSSF